LGASLTAMRYRPLHGTSSSVSALGLGTVKFGRNASVKYPEPFDLPSDETILDLLDLAASLGLNLLDTAPAYGSSEERLGQLLGARREHWVLVSKAGEEFADGVSRFDFAPAAIEASVERSLRRLRTDRLDCLLLHSDGNDLRILDESGALEALRRLQDSGKILAAGISTKTVEGSLRALELGLDVVMTTYRPGDAGEAEVLDATGRSGRSVLLKKALGSGWLPKGDGEDPVERALAFAFAHPAVTSAIVGTINPRHLEENVAAFERATA